MKVLVFMCTYNGEKYIKEQLDSILNQKDLDVTILISDDCSTDNTPNILQFYSEKYSNVKYRINKTNLNFTYNFINLIFDNYDLVKSFDYFALADQDDVWLDNKLISAVELLKQHSKDPYLYMSNLSLVDSNLNYIGLMQIKGNEGSNKNNFIFENICTGCTIVFNSKFYDLLMEYYPKSIYLHDYWIFMVAAYVGNFIYDNNSYIMYRQHSNNLIGNRRTPRLKLFLKIFKKERRIESTLCKELINGYKRYINDDDFHTLEKMAKYDKSIRYKFSLMFMKKYKRRKFEFRKKIKLLFDKY